MEARLKLDALLRKVLLEATGKENLYFQPPAGYKLKYPCIVYSESRIRNEHANDGVYIQRPHYTVTVMDNDPDSPTTAVLFRKTYITLCLRPMFKKEERLWQD